METLNLIYLVAPIFLIILLGRVLRVALIQDDDAWHQINSLSYWVLFPSLLFNKISVIDLNSFSFEYFSYVLILGFLGALLFSYIVGKVAGIKTVPLSSVLQGSGRHNSFVALAVASQFLGEQGELIGTIAVAVLVSFSNMWTVTMMTLMLRDKGENKWLVFKEIFKNPFIIAILIGLFFNIMNWGHLPVLHDYTGYLGKAALTLALLCVGAGLRFGEVKDQLFAALLSCAAKLVVFPILAFFIATAFELSHEMVIVAVIFAIAPTSSTCYAQAKHMGGDAPLMATIISMQTLISVIAIPVAILLVA